VDTIDCSIYSIQAVLHDGNFTIDYRSKETGNTPLLLALGTGKEEVAIELIRYGANVELSNYDGQTPLMVACSFNLLSAMREILIGVRDLELEDSAGMTALLWAISFAAQFSSLEIVQLLLRCGASIQAKDKYGGSPFLIAANFGSLLAVEYLLIEFEGIFSVHDCYEAGGSALHVASFNGHIFLVKALLLWGSDTRHEDQVGDTSRIWAQDQGHTGVVTLLEAWPPICALWMVRSVGEVPRLGKKSEFKRFPKNLCAMLGKFLV
jgi:ankyrin repeat protein